ncbi:hypothetical protein PFZ49_01955 [Microbacterium lacticum]|uniref:hypothetical protein n=1 Tax=Microbacterium lacticum TaxID=33885 RepID=UPI003A871110
MVDAHTPDSTLLSEYRAGRTPGATPAEKRLGDRSIALLIERHRSRAFAIRNKTESLRGLDDDTVESAYYGAILSCLEKFEMDGTAEFSTYLHAAIRNALRDEARKVRRRLLHETAPVVTTQDGELLDTFDLIAADPVESAHDYDDALRTILDALIAVAIARVARDRDEVLRVFVLRHLNDIAFPGEFRNENGTLRTPGRAEIAQRLGLTERRARTLIDHADALLEPLREQIARKFGWERPVERTTSV